MKKLIFSSVKKQTDFNLINLKGRGFYTPYFKLVLASNLFLGNNNVMFLGMKVSKRLAKKAYIRNKIKRRIRHLVRIVIKDQSLNLSRKAIIVIPYKNFELVKFTELLSHLGSVIQKSNCI